MEDRLKLIHNLNTAINKVRNFSTPNFNNVFSRQYSEDIIFNMLNYTLLLYYVLKILIMLLFLEILTN